MSALPDSANEIREEARVALVKVQKPKRRGGRSARLKRAQAGAATAAQVSAVPHTTSPRPAEGRVLFIGCGSLARGIQALARQKGWRHIDVEGLPPQLHNDPDKIPALLQERIRLARPAYDGRIFVAYGDCGTGGAIDEVCRQEGVRRVPGPHCYSFLSGNAAFACTLDENATTFYLTDFFVDHFDDLVIEELWIDRHPELASLYFEHYKKLLYLAQRDDPERDQKARRAAQRLGLDYERQLVGWGELEDFVDAGARSTGEDDAV